MRFNWKWKKNCPNVCTPLQNNVKTHFVSSIIVFIAICLPASVSANWLCQHNVCAMHELESFSLHRLLTLHRAWINKSKSLTVTRWLFKQTTQYKVCSQLTKHNLFKFNNVNLETYTTNTFHRWTIPTERYPTTKIPSSVVVPTAAKQIPHRWLRWISLEIYSRNFFTLLRTLLQGIWNCIHKKKLHSWNILRLFPIIISYLTVGLSDICVRFPYFLLNYWYCGSTRQNVQEMLFFPVLRLI